MSNTNFNHETPSFAASLSMDYPQFTAIEPPTGSAAESAWIGEIQPFASDDSARAFLHDIEEGAAIWLFRGRIREAKSSKTHWADPLLVDMSVQCRLLVLLQPSPAHPRAYMLSPRYPEYYSFVHPHPRGDQQIEWQNKKIPGLCIYSASEFKYDLNRERNSQFLDQVTLYVARHLIWLRTRQLFRGYPPAGELLRVLRPGELLLDDKVVMARRGDGDQKPVLDYWAGYWPGPSAEAFDPKTHLAKINPLQECWCGSGVSYQSCHRPADLNTIAGQG